MGKSLLERDMKVPISNHYWWKNISFWNSSFLNHSSPVSCSYRARNHIPYDYTLNKNINATCKWAEIKDPRIVPYAQNTYFSQMLCTNLFTSLLAFLLYQDNPSTWQVWHIKKLIKQHDHYSGVPCAGDNKRPMCSFVTQHNATDFEGVCNWHADCRNVHQSCFQRIECSFLYHKPTSNVVLKNLAVCPTGLTATDKVYGCNGVRLLKKESRTEMQRVGYSWL
jgi:hypothetical protein